MNITAISTSAISIAQTWIDAILRWIREYLLPEISRNIAIIEETYEEVRESIRNSFIGQVLALPLPVLIGAYLLINDKSKQLIGVAILIWYWVTT